MIDDVLLCVGWISVVLEVVGGVEASKMISAVWLCVQRHNFLGLEEKVPRPQVPAAQNGRISDIEVDIFVALSSRFPESKAAKTYTRVFLSSIRCKILSSIGLKKDFLLAGSSRWEAQPHQSCLDTRPLSLQ